MNRDSPDEELMTSYRDGEDAAFETLYSRHKGGLFRYLLRQCAQRTYAEEMFQDVWMNLINARRRYRIEAKFTTYLYKLAHNRLIDHYRRNATDAMFSYNSDESLIEGCTAAGLALEEKIEIAQQARILLDLLLKLPEAQREAFVLHEEAGLSIDEIAQVTGVNKETAKSRLRYAVARLRQGLMARNDE